MGIFFQGSKKIKEDEFKKAVKSIPELSDKEKMYVEGLFQDALEGSGITKEELKKEIKELKKDFNDPLDSNEVEKVKRKLESLF